MKKLARIISGISALLIAAISGKGCTDMNQPGTYGYDMNFLNTYKETIVLKNNDDHCQIAVVGDYQGRVMTSTSNGLNGKSYGWINYDLISSEKFNDHINVFGGEDRFWLGPEGGQYSIFFKKGDEFIFDNWFTPKSMDTEPFSLILKTDTNAVFNKKVQLTNYSNFTFDIEIEREISILTKRNIEDNLNISIDNDILFVAFQSKNVIRNIGSAWSKDNGLLSIWILGMFNPSDNTTVIIPYRDSLDLNTSYFGEIGPDRLRVDEDVVLFKGDGKYRSKIGLPPHNSKPVFGSYDTDNKVLTIVEYSFESDSSYVNSLWEHQEKPFSGDVINSYNDGPLDNGDILGPFYELESSSPARELKRGESIRHFHKTYHFEGNQKELNTISMKILGVDLKNVGIKRN